MNFSNDEDFEMYTRHVVQYRKNYFDYIIEKYSKTDEPDYIIDIQTLKVVEFSGDIELTSNPEFGQLNNYYCKPAHELINKIMKQEGLSPKRLSQKNKSKRRHVSIQNKRRKVRSKRKEKRHAPLELDISSKSLTRSVTLVDLTESAQIDPCSLLFNSPKKLKRTNNTVSLAKRNFHKCEILSHRLALLENRKQIKSELYFKHEVPLKIKRLKNKGSDVANRQIITKAACRTVKFTADSIPAFKKVNVSSDYSDTFSVNNSYARYRICQVSCVKLDLSKLEMSRKGSFMLNSIKIPCSNYKPLHEKVNRAKNSSLSVTTLNTVSKYWECQPINQSAPLSSKNPQDELFTYVNLGSPNSNNDSPECKEIDTDKTEQKISKAIDHGKISYANGMHLSKIAILPKDFENSHKKLQCERKMDIPSINFNLKTVSLKEIKEEPRCKWPW